MSPFAPDRLQPSTLRSLAKALKRASADLFDTPLPLGQAQELLARTFAYPNWATAIERAEQNTAAGRVVGPTGAPSTLALEAPLNPARRYAFVRLLGEMATLTGADDGTFPDRHWWGRLEEACATSGEPTWSLLCRQLGLLEKRPTDGWRRLTQAVGVPLDAGTWSTAWQALTAPPQAAGAEVPFPWTDPGTIAWEDHQAAWQTVLTSNEPFWANFLSGYVVETGTWEARRRQRHPVRTRPLLEQWQRQLDEDGRLPLLRHHVDSLMAQVPGAAILLKTTADWLQHNGNARNSENLVRLYRQVATWVKDTAVPAATPDPAARMHMRDQALQSERSRHLLLYVLSQGLDIYVPLPRLMTWLVTDFQEVGDGALAGCLADWVGQLQQSKRANPSLIFAQDLAHFDRPLAVRLHEGAERGTFAPTLKMFVQHPDTLPRLPVSNSLEAFLRMIDRLARHLQDGQTLHQVVHRMQDTARLPAPLGDAQEAAWLTPMREALDGPESGAIEAWGVAQWGASHPEFALLWRQLWRGIMAGHIESVHRPLGTALLQMVARFDRKAASPTDAP